MGGRSGYRATGIGPEPSAREILSWSAEIPHLGLRIDHRESSLELRAWRGRIYIVSVHLLFTAAEEAEGIAPPFECNPCLTQHTLHTMCVSYV